MVIITKLCVNLYQNNIVRLLISQSMFLFFPTVILLCWQHQAVSPSAFIVANVRNNRSELTLGATLAPNHMIQILLDGSRAKRHPRWVSKVYAHRDGRFKLPKDIQTFASRNTTQIRMF